MSAVLPQIKIDECKEVFKHFSNGGDVLTLHQLKEALYALGAEPTDQEVQKMMDDIDKDGNGTIDQSEFLQIFAEKMKDPDLLEDLIDAFKNFDIFNTGYLPITDLKRIMTSCGSKMSDTEFDSFLRIYTNQIQREENGLDNEEEEDKIDHKPEYDNKNYVNIKKFAKLLLS